MNIFIPNYIWDNVLWENGFVPKIFFPDSTRLKLNQLRNSQKLIHKIISYFWQNKFIQKLISRTGLAITMTLLGLPLNLIARKKSTMRHF